MKNTKGFTLIELSVVMVILGIVMALVVSQFTGMPSKNKVEADIKTLYADIVEMKLKSYSEHYDSTLKKEKNYGVYWNTGSFAADKSFTTYYKYYFTDADNLGTIDISEFYAPSQKSVTLPRSMSVDGVAPPVGIMFSGKGILKSASTVYVYSSCPECDQGVSSVSNAGKAADQSASCNDVSYPEYSCIAISPLQVKMGKWCDRNADGVFDPDPDPAVSECSLK
jgi:prepilin-type N-terminal cleavage/methylation domain-containing protein